MRLLALDTSTEACSVALRVGDEVQVRRHAGAREQTAHVLPMVQALLAEAGISLRELDAIACANGPGAFTGVRVAVSVVQGLAYGAQVPAVGISTLAALAQQALRREQAGGDGIAGDSDAARLASASGFVLPVLDARMGELYAGAYRRDDDGLAIAMIPDRLVRPDDFVAAVPVLSAHTRWRAIGGGWPLLAASVGALPVDPDAAFAGEPDALDVLALAARALTRGEAVPAERLLPVYLRDTVAWKKLSEQGKP